MYCVEFKYKNGKKGVCTKDGKIILFDIEKNASAFAENLNGAIEEGLKYFFPVWRAVKVKSGGVL